MKFNKLQLPNRKMLISILASLLILTGIIIAAFPYLQGVYYDLIKPPQTVEEVSTEDDTTEPEPAEVVDTADDDTPTWDRQGTLPQGSTAVLEIPKLGIKIDVLYGVSDDVLRQGIGFYPQSDDPNTGNVCIAGHRNAHGSPFWNLDKLMPGDSIILYYNDITYQYLVSMNYITDNQDWSVIEPTDKPAITLTTCDPKIRPANGEYNRLVIRGYIK